MTEQEFNSAFANLIDVYTSEVAWFAIKSGWTMRETGLHKPYESSFKTAIEEEFGVRLLGPIGHMRINSVRNIIYAKANNIPLQKLIAEKRRQK